MKLLTSHWKILLLAALAAVTAISVAAYFEALHSDAYRTAREFVNDNQELINALGPVKKCTLHPLGWQISYSGPNGVADFDLRVTGDKQEGNVFVSLETDLGQWKVVGAKLRLKDGKFIRLK